MGNSTTNILRTLIWNVKSKKLYTRKTGKLCKKGFTVGFSANINQRKAMTVRKCSRSRNASKKTIDVAKFEARVQINALTRTKTDVSSALHSSEWKITNCLAFDKAWQVHKFLVPSEPSKVAMTLTPLIKDLTRPSLEFSFPDNTKKNDES